MFEKIKHYCGLIICTFNAIYHFIVSNRNYGKTWNFKYRAWKRAYKRGKKTIWLRTFKKEVKECTSTFYSSADLQKWCGIVPYDPQTKQGNFKQIGRTFYIKRGKQWVWFLKIFAVSDANACRSADDVDCDTIVYDEFTTTPDQLRRFQGNIVDKFNDIFFSAKREHVVKCFFLGNKENARNPFFEYFDIKQLPHTFEGIRTYRNGAIVVEQINNKQIEQSEYDVKLKDLFNGTKYGNYIYNDEYKSTGKFKQKQPPRNATHYIQLNIEGAEIRVYVDTVGNYYCTNKIDKLTRVYTIKQLNEYRNETLLIKRFKPYFNTLINALADGRVYYQNQAIYEAIQPFYKWLGI